MTSGNRASDVHPGQWSDESSDPLPSEYPPLSLKSQTFPKSSLSGGPMALFLRTTSRLLDAKNPSCTLCGEEGIYLLEGKPYCPSCLSKKHPPFPYTGPERRRHQIPTLWHRRQSDFEGKRPSTGDASPRAWGARRDL